MKSGLGWAKNPMLNRINDFRDDKPLTLLYGSRSWIDKTSWDKVKLSRISSYVNVQVIRGAGHHVYSDKPEIFNRFVNDACFLCDNMDGNQITNNLPGNINNNCYLIRCQNV